ncbi:MAG: hypothetical protein JRF33_05070 [Deltaproteobacteria bacterium]|nr:hypothetical protein [Deltaproteobacteria bacterium]
MKKLSVKVLTIALGISFLFVMLVAWQGHKRPVVQSQPLSCFELGEMLICMDGQIHEQMNCERLDENTIFCSPGNGHAV